MDTTAADVFLSYSRTDAEAVRRVQGHLQAAGLATFLDRDHLPAGQPWLPALEQAIARCGAVAVFVGPVGLGTWQQREVQLALDRQAEAERTGRRFPVIPSSCPRSRIRPVASSSSTPGSTCAPTLPTPSSSSWLLTGIRGRARPTVAPSARRSVPTAACCRSARRMPACSSVARRRSTTLLAKLRAHDLITLVGRSGSGKSSVVYAGLIPALRRRADGRTWSILSLRPGPEPLHALVRLFDPPPADLPPFEADHRVEQQVEILRSDGWRPQPPHPQPARHGRRAGHRPAPPPCRPVGGTLYPGPPPIPPSPEQAAADVTASSTSCSMPPAPAPAPSSSPSAPTSTATS